MASHLGSVSVLEVSEPLHVVEYEPGQGNDGEDDEGGGHEQHGGSVDADAHDGRLAHRD